MNIEELAAELGRAIKDDPRIAAMNTAHDAYDADVMLQSYLQEYDAQQNAIEEEGEKPNADKLLIAKLQGRVDELYKLIINNASFTKMGEAQAAVNELMESVNNIITYNITGEMPSCTHDCSSCGGHCH